MTDNFQAPRIQFHEHHIPSVESGDYEVEVSGTVSKDSRIDEDLPLKVLDFSVFGERFSLNPLDIRAVFPKDNSTGEYSRVLPHIVLNRNTLPWERHAVPEGGTTPWMALLLFDEDEIPEKKVITLGNEGEGSAGLQNLMPSEGTGYHPEVQLETAQHPEDKVTVIEVRKDLLEKLLPSFEDLSLLAHTRQGVDNVHHLAGEENAVVFCNRLPELGKRSTIHLVSVEGRYNKDGFVYPGEPEDNTLIRLVSLKSWNFYTLEHFKITHEGLVEFGQVAEPENQERLSTLAGREYAGTQEGFFEWVREAMELEELSGPYRESLEKHFKFNRTFDQLLKKLNKELLTFRLPKGTGFAEEHFKQGLVPLEQHFRNGSQSVSWYRGPFIPLKGITFQGDGEHKGINSIHPQTADELLRYNQEKGMFDVTYSAAWEIGRLLALSDKDFSTSLFQWKRLKERQMCRQKQNKMQDLAHLPVMNLESEENESTFLWEKHIKPFFDKIITFKSIPANYLVPDERLLPVESIRFFKMDRNWIQALITGAFCVGGDWDKNRQEEDTDFLGLMNLANLPTMGCLLRSDVVDGWPGLIIDGIPREAEVYSVDHDEIELAAIPALKIRLSKDVLLCLFPEDMSQVRFHQKAEVMHVGLGRGVDTHEKEIFVKRIRDENGKEMVGAENEKEIPWKLDETDRVIDMGIMAERLGKADNKADFAMNMIEGVPKVIFNVGESV